MDKRTDAERRLAELQSPTSPAPRKQAPAPPSRPGLLRRAVRGVRRFYRVWLQPDTESRQYREAERVVDDATRPKWWIDPS